ncbi:diguanylate cyclase [Demequina sp. SYSU T00039]|uniref:Diguanylate cyclase n=1 Tax=Demequina lignilytica TaxID=3051663 RepID=A0AAW7LZZ6_9MICO|nr:MULTISPECIES: diguanylate cyclase [unclassified Demequina]MDN4477076.1 diguanylate cyclase [Demequina sp. SYSU T00039-1]MDN4487249.1 diguanylate cyclase [Demequina sp. SYSU T00039]MDN4491500.1 diguanylate cyclase [Demequina sp. SYSU T00068]
MRIRKLRLRVSRLRGMLVAAVAVVAILVVQALIAVTAVVVADRGAEAAARDTYSYVGDLMTERVATALDSASDVVRGTVSELDRRGVPDTADLIGALADRLDREPGVGSIFIGWPSGEVLAVATADAGYTVYEITPIDGDPGRAHVERSELGPDHAITAIDAEDGAYDLDTRPWYDAAVDGAGLTWTDPYISVRTGELVVSPVQALSGDGGSILVVGADLDPDSLGALLDDIPIGEDAGAFILTGDRRVIAAPAGSRDLVRDVLSETGEVPLAGEIGLPSTAPTPGGDGGDVFATRDTVVTLERSLDPATGLDWILHLETDARDLAPGLASFRTATFTIAAVSLALVAVASILAWQMWRPVRTMRHRASTDALTGLANRYEFPRRLRGIVASARTQGDTVMVVALDLDDFKRLNDAEGHDAGDVVLAAVGDAMLASLRTRDVAARLGGDEFAAVLRLAERGSPVEVARRLRDDVEIAIHESLRAAGVVGVTAGFATTAECGYDPDALVSAADEALVTGKRAHKGRTYAFGHVAGTTGQVPVVRVDDAAGGEDGRAPAGSLPGDRR